MKIFKTNKVIFAALAVMIIVSLMPFIQSCSNTELNISEETPNYVELNASEKNEIINSIEFENYVVANIEIAAFVKSQKTSSKTSNQSSLICKH